VLDSNEIARGFLEVAVELWQLAGREGSRKRDREADHERVPS
jgi:hypothetical protein